MHFLSFYHWYCCLLLHWQKLSGKAETLHMLLLCSARCWCCLLLSLSVTADMIWHCWYCPVLAILNHFAQIAWHCWYCVPTDIFWHWCGTLTYQPIFLSLLVLSGTNQYCLGSTAWNSFFFLALMVLSGTNRYCLALLVLSGTAVCPTLLKTFWHM
jgi:hypothetical protein